MKRLICILSIVVLWPLNLSWAQLAPPNQAGVALGHWHTTVSDVEATKKFWTTLGGIPLKIDGTEVIKFPGVLIFLTKGFPSGGSFGSVTNHVGFHVPNVDGFIARLKEGGATSEYVRSVFIESYVGWAYTPDNLKVELISDNSLAVPIAGPDLQLWVIPSAMADAQAWYTKVFGGVSVPGATTRNVRVDGIPGVRLIIQNSQDPRGLTPRAVGLVNGALPVADSPLVASLINPPSPTKGRTLDHIGFEVTNLEAYCKKLEASGVKFDAPYSKARHQSFASAELTDPWGVSIELTEGLRRF